MLPKKRRLNAAQVREVIASGKSLKGSVISAKYLVKQGLFGIAVVVPKAVARLASDRNRIRRALYHAIASLSAQDAKGLGGVAAVFFIRSTPSPLVPVLKKDIAGILAKFPRLYV